MNNRLKLFAATALMLVVACSEAPKTSYTIQGTATGLADGTKLLLADGDGQALDTLVVSDGKFTYSGPADSVSMIAIYELENPVNNVSFFTDSIPYTQRCAKVKQISVADMFAETIRRVINNESISDQYLV